MGYFCLEHGHEQSFNFDTKKDREKSVSRREFYCEYNGVIFICFYHQFILNWHKKGGETFCIMKLFAFFFFILLPGNCVLLFVLNIVMFLLFFHCQ